MPKEAASRRYRLERLGRTIDALAESARFGASAHPADIQNRSTLLTISESVESQAKEIYADLLRYETKAAHAQSGCAVWESALMEHEAELTRRKAKLAREETRLNKYHARLAQMGAELHRREFDVARREVDFERSKAIARASMAHPVQAPSVADSEDKSSKYERLKTRVWAGVPAPSPPESFTERTLPGWRPGAPKARKRHTYETYRYTTEPERPKRRHRSDRD
ncbi:hypothetical protein M501DRAFT_1056298 [Patellaria atrata CBS 101060]|uniref:Uncharacterized protein n=1 Tax=Patellaria atrata CBS 101060 TaxID=1346257 RepID=A0A9P4SFV9_9PEZI|nr:hypothetical protein M501DRAFT_1056298 [Patellaria atrata CBS 101060]